MPRNYTNLENFNKLVIIFLEDGKMVSTMSVLSLGRGKVALYMWWGHHGDNIPCNHMLSPRISQMEHKDMLHATYRLKIAICHRHKRHLPQRDRCYCPYELLMKRPNN
jgi:hypothetical protein